jgi:glutathione S-transferase
LLNKVDYALLFEITPQQLPFRLRQLLGQLVRPVVKHFLGDQRDIYQVLEDSLSEEHPWFSGKKMGLADFYMSFAMDMATQRGYFKAEKIPQWHAVVVDRPAYKGALDAGRAYELVNIS